MEKTTLLTLSLFVLTFGLIFKNGWLLVLGGVIFAYSIFKKKVKELGVGETGPVRAEIKRVVSKRQKGKCGKNGCNIKRYLVLHHIVPRHLGGDNRVSNLIYLCPNHHSEAHDNNGKATFNGVPKYLKGVRQ